MRFDIQRAFNQLLDLDISLYRRAVTLFELQVAILACTGLAKKTSKRYSAFTINAPTNLLRSARTLATLQLLQHKADLYDKDGQPDLFKSIALVADKHSLDLIGDLIFGKIGLERVRYAQKPRHFSEALAGLTNGSDSVVSLFDYSLRFQPVKKRPRVKGGITNALEIVYADQDSQYPIYHQSLKVDAARNYARKLKSISALLWLVNRSGGFLPPPKIHTKAFAKKILQQAGRIDELELIAASYTCVANRLSQRGYPCPPLKLERPVKRQEIVFEPLPEQLLDLI